MVTLLAQTRSAYLNVYRHLDPTVASGQGMMSDDDRNLLDTQAAQFIRNCMTGIRVLQEQLGMTMAFLISWVK